MMRHSARELAELKASLSLEDAAYPFEFTIPLEKNSQLSFYMEGKKIDGSYSKSSTIELGP